MVIRRRRPTPFQPTVTIVIAACDLRLLSVPPGQLLQFQEMGFGVAAALILDATLIRLVILPSTLSLLGQRSWYLPRWLD